MLQRDGSQQHAAAGQLVRELQHSREQAARSQQATPSNTTVLMKRTRPLMVEVLVLSLRFARSVLSESPRGAHVAHEDADRRSHGPCTFMSDSSLGCTCQCLLRSAIAWRRERAAASCRPSTTRTKQFLLRHDGRHDDCF